MQYFLFVSIAVASLVHRLDAAQIINERFNYPDGPLVSAPGTLWTNNYLPSGEANVVSGRLFLTDAENESVRVDFRSNAVNVGQSVYAGFTVNFSALPKGQGNFFAFFRQFDVDNLRARVWVSTNDAAPGKFRLGIVTLNETAVMIPQDLSLNTSYRLVTKLQNQTPLLSTLWINPVNEADTTLRADSSFPSSVPSTAHFGFLQTSSFLLGAGNSMGQLTVDNLRVGTTFADAELARITNFTKSGVVQLGATGLPLVNAIVQANTTVTNSTAWVDLGTTNFDANGVLQFSDTNSSSFANRFYRLSVP